MERVQYHQEQMLPELKDFVKKGVFSPAEVKEIVKRRTAFETALVRRVADKADFLRYAHYEMGLEALRKKRLRRLKLPPSPPSISDYAIVRRQYYIFERAIRKFKADLSIWTQYIDLARQNGAKGLVGRLCARALQLHPNAPALYILSSLHEMSQGSPSAARALLQRGLRFNVESVELWTEYVKMELSYVEGLRRRWDVLGIGEGQETASSNEGSKARREVMSGAVVRTVIDSAVKASPTLPLFRSIYDTLRVYPSGLVPSLLSRVHELLQITFPTTPEAVFLGSTGAVTSALEGDSLVDALRTANEELLQAVDILGDDMLALYGGWVDDWASKLTDENNDLSQYLRLSLQRAAKRERRKYGTRPPPESLLAAASA